MLSFSPVCLFQNHTSCPEDHWDQWCDHSQRSISLNSHPPLPLQPRVLDRTREIWPRKVLSSPWFLPPPYYSNTESPLPLSSGLLLKKRQSVLQSATCLLVGVLATALGWGLPSWRLRWLSLRSWRSTRSCVLQKQRLVASIFHVPWFHWHTVESCLLGIGLVQDPAPMLKIMYLSHFHSCLVAAEQLLKLPTCTVSPRFHWRLFLVPPWHPRMVYTFRLLQGNDNGQSKAMNFVELCSYYCLTCT